MALSNDCDPAGDLVLKLGSSDEVTLIRVQSRVLSLASPVFAAMLSPRFAEGKALEDSAGMAKSLTAIDLPDDDPRAMGFICRLLHFKEDADRPTSYQPFTMMRLAEICDKYDMSRALSPWTNVWMYDVHTIVPKPEWPESLWDMAWISYVLRHNIAFWYTTQAIVRNSTVTELYLQNGLLPDNVLGESPPQS